MNHTLITNDISGNAYIRVDHPDVTMAFLYSRVEETDEEVVVPSLKTLTDAPRSARKAAERYLENQGYVIV